MQHDAHLRASHRTSLFVTIATGRIGTDLPKQPGSDVRCDVFSPNLDVRHIILRRDGSPRYCAGVFCTWEIDAA